MFNAQESFPKFLKENIKFKKAMENIADKNFSQSINLLKEICPNETKEIVITSKSLSNEKIL